MVKLNVFCICEISAAYHEHIHCFTSTYANPRSVYTNVHVYMMYINIYIYGLWVKIHDLGDHRFLSVSKNHPMIGRPDFDPYPHTQMDNQGKD